MIAAARIPISIRSRIAFCLAGYSSMAKCTVLRVVCEHSGVPLTGALFEEELWTE